MSRKQRALAQCAPITQNPATDRAMRVATMRARRSGGRAELFAHQQAFDQAIAALVRATHVSTEITEWFANESLVPLSKRTWKKTARNPAVLSIGLALAVIAGVFVFKYLEHRNDFPGSALARRLLTIASATRSAQLDPVQTEAGALGDLFFMKHRLEHYDVPREFAGFRTTGSRVFDDEEGSRVGHIAIAEKRMQFFLFPAQRNPKDGKVSEFAGWRYVEHEGWTGAVHLQDGVCFMAAIRGEEKDLAPYVSKPEP